MKTLRKAFVSLVTMSVLAMPTTAVFAQAQPTTTPAPAANSSVSNVANGVCQGVLSASTGTIAQNATVASCQENGNESFSFLIKKIINIFSIVVGAVSVIMIIIGGFRYIISGGDSSGVTGAKNTILYAIVGLVIVLFAQVIIRFVLTNVAPSS